MMEICIPPVALVRPAQTIFISILAADGTNDFASAPAFLSSGILSDHIDVDARFDRHGCFIASSGRGLNRDVSCIRSAICQRLVSRRLRGFSEAGEGSTDNDGQLHGERMLDLCIVREIFLGIGPSYSRVFEMVGEVCV